ncbi:MULTISPECIES: hypothetical protein [unclassified Paenibacillus]|uniref:hypothetical protein n=1 Tax=unclassified Paenibacillus TaxID=185978 RepID=UPI003643C47F
MADLNKLIQLVRAQIRDKGGVIFALPKPASEETPAEPDELEPMVQNVVDDYSRWRPLRGKPGQLELHIEQIEYTLPDDLIELESFPKEYFRYNKFLTLSDAPIQEETIRYVYTAMHMAETIPHYDVPALVGMAAANALRAVVSDPNKIEEYISFKLEGVLDIDTRNTSEVSREILKTAAEFEKQYLLRVQHQTSGPYMSFG